MFFYKHDVYKHIQAQVWKWFFMQINYLCISYVLFVDIFTRSFDDFISMKFLIAVFLPASLFIPTCPFINFGDFCHPRRLLFLPKFSSLLLYSALPFYLKLDSRWMCWWDCWQSDKLSRIQIRLFPSVSHIDSHPFREWWRSLLDYHKNHSSCMHLFKPQLMM